MGIDRILLVDLDTAVKLLEGTKWKFFEVEEEQIRIEVPRSTGENLVINLDYSNKAYKRLIDEGFYRQEIKPQRV